MSSEEEQVPNEYLQAIGDVTVRWNALENFLNFGLIKLLGKEIEEGRSLVLFAHMAFPQKLDVLSALIGQVHFPADHPLQRYKTDIQPLLKEAQASRNRIIHSMWGVENGKVSVTSISARGSLKLKSEPVSLEEIKAVSALIIKAARALMKGILGKEPVLIPHSGQ